MKQVITIEPDGTLSGLQRKPGQGLDLRQFGKANIERASLIEWDADQQAWFIDVLQTEGKGKLTFDMFAEAQGAKRGDHPRRMDAFLKMRRLCPSGFGTATHGVGDDRLDETTLLFAEYDEAVKVEIEYLDALRLKGMF